MYSNKWRESGKKSVIQSWFSKARGDEGGAYWILMTQMSVVDIKTKLQGLDVKATPWKALKLTPFYITFPSSSSNESSFFASVRPIQHFFQSMNIMVTEPVSLPVDLSAETSAEVRLKAADMERESQQVRTKHW